MEGFDILRILQVVLGIGLVIFVHEAGHFLAARLCGVRVQVFSLGFGPPLLAFRRRGTVYQIAAVPVGGYVKMAGDEPTAEGRAWARREERLAAGRDPLDEPEADDATPRDGDLYSKSVGQRFFIFSGGVLMNLAFGAAVFPVLFSYGVPFTQPLLRPTPAGPAWRAGIPAGTRVLAVNGQEVFDFDHVPLAVALGDPERADLRVLLPGEQEPRDVSVVPERDPSLGMYSLGVWDDFDPAGRIRVEPHSPAWNAGLRTDMRLVAVEGGVPGLTPGEQLLDALGSSAPIEVRVDTGEGVAPFRIAPRTTGELTSRPLLGIQPPAVHVEAVRPTPETAALGLRAQDRLRTVDGARVLHDGDFRTLLARGSGPLSVGVRRDGADLELRAPDLDGAARLALADAVALSRDTDSTEIVVTPGWAAAEAGLRDGDIVQRVDGDEVGSWNDILELVGEAGRTDRPLRIEVLRTAPGAAEAEALALEATPRREPILEYGLAPRRASYVYRADGPADAVRVGLLCSWRFVEDTWLTLRRMVTGEVSSKNIGGIITISHVSYRWSEQGLAKLFFFLCILSINLAILNVLPIPVLDGGHLMFLLIEKVKGSPPSDRFLGYSQMVGLVLILSLMVYVTYNDLARLFRV